MLRKDPAYVASIGAKKQLELRGQLRRINLERRKDKEALLARVKAANILLMPILVVIVGVALAFVRKKKTAAK